ncbi:helix-turn-helix transcriptional regulator [Patulibacter defluvii]|uniref:helix-turn-helix transcriptional regulator n=1 Tax=Patulibacter defluvii TaxID=3095358 RepID=UPI002A74AE8F|nr:AraC family transcriptional regulator [Patulibacter sp. DM4]
MACAFDGRPLELELDDRRLTAAAVAIPSNVPHRLGTLSRRVAILFAEPLGLDGRRVDAVARARLGQPLNGLLGSLAWPAADAAAARAFVAGALGRLGGAPAGTAPLSEPVAAAAAYVERTLPGPPTLVAAAQAAHLSPSRLTHRFSPEIGLPFRRYVLWMRLRLAVARLAEGGSLTRAAADAGFSDSAHLSRSFRRAFGLPPSALLAMRLLADDDRSVQAAAVPPA